jgi:NADH-quinone oxidoreductase subunit J
MTLIAFITLGALGLYLAMPGGKKTTGIAGMLLLFGAAAALLRLMVERSGGDQPDATFVVLSLLALLSAVRVITHQKPVYCALYFVLVVLSTAGLMVLLNATFLAAAIVIIYAGAILVTYVFVIMLASQSGGPAAYDRSAREPLLGVAAGLFVLAGLTTTLFRGDRAPAADLPAAAGDVVAVGTRLMTTYSVGVELAGVLLLAAMVGAIAVARRTSEAEEPA